MQRKDYFGIIPRLFKKNRGSCRSIGVTTTMVAPHTGHGVFKMTTCTCNARNNTPATPTYTYILWVNDRCTIVPYDTEEEATRDGLSYLAKHGASTFRVEKWQD